MLWLAGSHILLGGYTTWLMVIWPSVLQTTLVKQCDGCMYRLGMATKARHSGSTSYPLGEYR
jgi:hypothetical protein